MFRKFEKVTIWWIALSTFRATGPWRLVGRPGIIVRTRCRFAERRRFAPGGGFQNFYAQDCPYRGRGLEKEKPRFLTYGINIDLTSHWKENGLQ